MPAWFASIGPPLQIICPDAVGLARKIESAPQIAPRRPAAARGARQAFRTGIGDGIRAGGRHGFQTRQRRDGSQKRGGQGPAVRSCPPPPQQRRDVRCGARPHLAQPLSLRARRNGLDAPFCADLPAILAGFLRVPAVPAAPAGSTFTSSDDEEPQRKAYRPTHSRHTGCTRRRRSPGAKCEFRNVSRRRCSRPVEPADLRQADCE